MWFDFGFNLWVGKVGVWWVVFYVGWFKLYGNFDYGWWKF